MFEWFWEFLYMLSKTLFRLIDGLILCANKLCGIDTINFEGEETDLMTYLFFSDQIGFAFRVSAILATILVVVFTVFMIIRSIAKDKAEGTPAQIAIKSFKTLLMFFLVPVIMVAFMTLGNAFVKALYSATSRGTSTPGAFLFSTFAIDGGMKPEFAEFFRIGDLNYYDTSLVQKYMNISDFPFLFSWLAGGVVLFSIASAMLVFVDRVLSIVILYIAAPISLATSVIDEGARFKLWRDQFLTKFIMGYGMIIAINIYALVCSLVTNPDMTFFVGEDLQTQFLNMVMKLLLIGGGAVTLQKSMALVGNLVSAGAGSNELRDNAFSAGALASKAFGLAGGVAGKALSMAGGIAGLPLKPVKSIVSDAATQWSRNKANSLLNFLGMGDKPKKEDGDEKSDSKNNEKADYGSSSPKDAINGEGFKTSFDSGDKGNGNNGKAKTGGDAVNKAIDNGGGGKGDNKKQDQKNQQPKDQQPKEDNKK